MHPTCFAARTGEDRSAGRRAWMDGTRPRLARLARDAAPFES